VPERVNGVVKRDASRWRRPKVYGNFVHSSPVPAIAFTTQPAGLYLLAFISLFDRHRSGGAAQRARNNRLL
jgi:hypothetical protein